MNEATHELDNFFKYAVNKRDREFSNLVSIYFSWYVICSDTGRFLGFVGLLTQEDNMAGKDYSGSGRRPDIDPITNFNFKVLINEKSVGHFSSVDGLSCEAEMIEYRDSTQPNVPLFRQGRRKPAHITLKRGVLTGYSAENDLFAWINQVGTGTVAAKNITIELLGDSVNGNYEKAATYTIIGCVPTKWSISSLEGNGNAIAIDSLELVGQVVSRSK